MSAIIDGKGNSQQDNQSSYRKSVLVSQAFQSYLAVKAKTLHPIEVGDVTIPADTLVLVQPLNEGTASFKSQKLNCRLYVIKKLPDGANPEEKRNIDIESVHDIELTNHQTVPTMIKRMRSIHPLGTTEEDVKRYLEKEKNKLPQGTAAFICSAGGTKLFYVNTAGEITQLAVNNPGMLKEFNAHVDKHNLWGKKLTSEQAKIIYSGFKRFIHFNFIGHYKLIGHNEPIFPNENSPCINEIKQTSLPNCFLLAAIQSILNDKDGSKFIKGMITDMHDGTIVVRLFDPVTLAPCLVRILKAELMENDKSLNGHTGLWIQALENAYAAMGRRHNMPVGPSVDAVFSGGGSTDFALKMLTGKSGKDINMQLPPKDSTPSFMNKESIESILMHEAMYKEVGLSEEEILVQINKQIQGIFSDVSCETLTEEEISANKKPKLKYRTNLEVSQETIQAVHEYLTFYKDHKEACDNILDDDTTTLTEKTDKIKTFFIENNAPESLLGLCDSTKKELAASSLTAFSGHYSESALDLHKTIEENIVQKNFVTAGTRKKKDFESGRFQALPGIACGHAYSIHGAYSTEVTVNGVKREVYFILVRNPWGEGSMGMRYQENDSGEVVAEKTNEPLFAIELNDFMLMFDGVTITEKGSLLHFDRIRTEVQTIIRENDFSFSKDLSTEELLHKKAKLDLLNEQFIAMEFLHLEAIPDNVKADIQVILDSGKKFSAQKTAIEKILKENNIHIPFYHGKDDDKYTHLFNLIKLKDAIGKKDIEPELISFLKNEIILTSGYVFYKELLSANKAFDMLIRANIMEISIDIPYLYSELQNMDNYIAKITKELFEDENNVDAKDTFQQVLSSKIETLKALLTKIEGAEKLLGSVDFVLKEELQEMRREINVKMKEYEQILVDGNSIASFDNNIRAIEENLERLKKRLDVLDADSYKIALNQTIKSIDKMLANMEHNVETLEQRGHIFAPDMRKKFEEISSKVEALKSSIENDSPKDPKKSNFSLYSFLPTKSKSSGESSRSSSEDSTRSDSPVASSPTR